MRKPPSAVSSTVLSGSREMSISRVGRSTSSFIRSIRLVPPAMNFAVGIGRDLAHRVGDVVGARILEIDHDLPHRLLDRRDDVGIGAAAADVAAHQLADLVGGLRLAFGDQPGRRADLSRRAVAALERVMVDERLLQRMQRAVRRQAFDRGDLGAVLHDGQRQAGIDAPAVDQHRAGAALAVVAALLGAGQVEVVAQRVEQGRPRRDLELRLDAVDGQRDRNFVRGRDSRLTVRAAALVPAMCISACPP